MLSVWYNDYNNKGENKMIEVWKDIEGFEGLYQVSNLGRIKSAFREGTKGGIIKQFIINRYPKVHLHKDGVSHFIYTHRLVAKAFIPNPLNKPQVNHKNGNKHDNRAVNLEWATSQENLVHAIETGLRKFKKVAQIKNGTIIKVWHNANRASIETGIKYPSIWRVLNGKFKTAGGYEWKYVD